MDKLRTSDKIIVGAGALLLVSSFLPWFRTCIRILGVGGCVSHNGWSNVLSLLGVLLGVAMAVLIVLERMGTVKLPDVGNLSWSQLYFFSGIAVAALVVLQLLVGDSPLGRSWGLIVGVVAAAGVAYGGFLGFNEAKSAGTGGMTGPGAPPPPPPPPPV